METAVLQRETVDAPDGSALPVADPSDLCPDCLANGLRRTIASHKHDYTQRIRSGEACPLCLGTKHGRAMPVQAEDFLCAWRQWQTAEYQGRQQSVTPLTLDLFADWLKANPQLRYGRTAQMVAWYGMQRAGSVKLSGAMAADLQRTIDPKRPRRGVAVGEVPDDLASLDLAALLNATPAPIEPEPVPTLKYPTCKVCGGPNTLGTPSAVVGMCPACDAAHLAPIDMPALLGAPTPEDIARQDARLDAESAGVVVVACKVCGQADCHTPHTAADAVPSRHNLTPEQRKVIKERLAKAERGRQSA